MQGTFEELAEKLGMSVVATRDFVRMLQRKGHARVVGNAPVDRPDKRGYPKRIFRIAKTVTLF